MRSNGLAGALLLLVGLAITLGALWLLNRPGPGPAVDPIDVETERSAPLERALPLPRGESEEGSPAPSTASEREPVPGLADGSSSSELESDHAIVRGRCIAAESGLPLAGCTAKFTGSSRNSQAMALHEPVTWKAPDPVITGDDGRFEIVFEAMPPYQHFLDIQCEARMPRTARWGAFTPGQIDDLGDIPFASGVRVQGRVLDTEGQPAEKVGVRDRRRATGGSERLTSGPRRRPVCDLRSIPRRAGRLLSSPRPSPGAVSREPDRADLGLRTVVQLSQRRGDRLELWCASRPPVPLRASRVQDPIPRAGWEDAPGTPSLSVELRPHLDGPHDGRRGLAGHRAGAPGSFRHPHSRPSVRALHAADPGTRRDPGGGCATEERPEGRSLRRCRPRSSSVGRALKAWQENAPDDIILIDLQMPVLDGYAATSELRQHGYTGPIIALSANALEEDRQRCLDLGCDDHESKPIRWSSLLAKIRTHLPPAPEAPRGSTPA